MKIPTYQRVAALVATIAVTAGACGGGKSNNAKPAPAVATTSNPQAAERAAVLAAYDEYNRFYVQAIANPDPNNPALAKHLTGSALSRMQLDLGGFQSTHEGVRLSDVGNDPPVVVSIEPARAVIEDCTLGNGVLIRQSCILEQSTVSDRAQIGPFAHLRPGSDIRENAHVGNFVETKKTRLGRGSKANHLTYLGDAEIGEGVNIGAGTITCNYDGVNKHTTRIEDGVFVGSDSTLVAPVTLGKGSYVGAASCITDPVPANSLALGRAKQIVKEGWAKARRDVRSTTAKK